jgi:predicted nucleotidyltransferase
MTIREVLSARREEVLAAAQRHGASQVRVIGSVARGADGPGSDIDFLVSWEHWTSLLDCAALSQELEEMLDRKVDIASDGWIRPELREGIYRDAQPL